MILEISILVSFLTTFLVTPILMRFLSRIGVIAIDQHKKNKPILPSSGGLCVVVGVLAGVFTYIGLSTFLTYTKTEAVNYLAIVSSVLIVTIIGLFDDLNVTSKKTFVKGIKDIRIGLPQWVKPLLTIPASIPLIVISAGNSFISLPFFGLVYLGVLYPLLVIPIVLVGISNAINMLGGFNGAEAGMGFVYLLSLGIFSILTGSIAAPIFLIGAASLLAFLIYNWYPAKILPGDSLTYLIGSLIATGVIIGNMEKLGLILLTPFIIEFFLKLRMKFNASSLGKLERDGKLDAPYGKNIYSLTHLIMNSGRFTERQVSIILIMIQLIVSVIGVYLAYFHYL